MTASAVETLIVGAGLAGLSAAYHLGDRAYRLIEREDQVGGLCRSVRADGFTFDFTGHLLHMRRPEIRELVLELLGEEAFERIDRHSGIYSHGVFTEYPFQVNTHGLPREVVRECVAGFAETLQSGRATMPDDPSFGQWILATFGPGIARHFMEPYNRKLFCADLDTLTADWVAWSIPKPTWEDVVRGALGQNRKAFGYNPSFLYPKPGGIDHLPRALLPHVDPPTLRTSLVSIDTRRREARLSNGERVRYERLLSTIPLPALLAALEDAPPPMAAWHRRLRWVSVTNLNLGFDAPSPVPYHWVYFPEARFPFYRAGVYSNLCPASVPGGHSGFYVEVSHPPGEQPPEETLVETCRNALLEAGLVPRGARLRCVRVLHIPVAYVIHDRARRELLPNIRRFLEEHSIHSIGRYGSWEYSAMEDALWQGREAARAIAEA